MYNLLVSGDDESWNGEPFIIDFSRCVREYTDKEITEKYGMLNDDQIEAKSWCGIEFKAIREILAERNDEKIMYIKMDDGKVDGVFRTDGYIDGTKHTSKEIAEFIQERIDLLP